MIADYICTQGEKLLSYILENYINIAVCIFLLWIIAIVLRAILGHEPHNRTGISACIGLLFFYIVSMVIFQNPSNQNFMIACIPFINEAYDGFDLLLSLNSDMMNFILNLSKLMLFSMLFSLMEEILSGAFSTQNRFMQWYMGECIAYILTLLSMFILNLMIFDPVLSWSGNIFSEEKMIIPVIIAVFMVELIILIIPVLFSENWLRIGLRFIKSLIITLLLVIAIGLLSRSNIVTPTALNSISGILTFIPMVLLLIFVWYVTASFL